MSRLEQLIKSTEALIAATEAPAFTQGSPVHTTNQSQACTDLLSDKAKLALFKKSTTAVIKMDNGDVYACIYLNVITKTTNIPLGLKKICHDLNTLAEHGLIHSCLAEPSSVDLNQYGLSAPSSAIYSFVLVPSDKMDLAKSLCETSTEDGKFGKTLEPLDLPQDPGDFHALISISHGSTLVSSNPQSMIDDQIALYLSVLPKGTQVVSIQKQAVQTLALNYLVHFRNPLMASYKEVRMNKTRDVVVIDDKMVQFNRFDGIEYIKKDS